MSLKMVLFFIWALLMMSAFSITIPPQQQQWLQEEGEGNCSYYDIDEEIDSDTAYEYYLTKEYLSGWISVSVNATSGSDYIYVGWFSDNGRASLAQFDQYTFNCLNFLPCRPFVLLACASRKDCHFEAVVTMTRLGNSTQGCFGSDVCSVQQDIEQKLLIKFYEFDTYCWTTD
mmetsp:Transcript_13141/g.17890  ORF Transcript_13141/g.17890 Transcript_13141/m.17890 type:complete len:173 (+) Transcript_13141:122-640(+)